MFGFLDHDDIDFLIRSLQDTRKKFDEYDYPAEELRREKLERVDEIVDKLNYLKEELDQE